MGSQIRTSLAFLGIVSLAVGSLYAQKAPIPASTAIPVTFTHTLEAGMARPSEMVTAKTNQAVLLPGGQVLPKGSIVQGHVVQSTAFAFDSTPYAEQKPSVLSIHFDKVVVGGTAIPVSLSVRAISGPAQTYEASIVRYANDSDTAGTRNLIGGSSFSPLDNVVTSPTGDTVGYVREQGVFARLLAGDDLDSTLQCSGTVAEQSVDIFSANACGVYGLAAVSMTDNGGNGTFVLESRRHPVKVYAGSAALLQVL